MKENKNHWYDGWFYDRIIAPNQDTVFSQLQNLLDPQSNILDVGCGTGRLAFALAPSCASIVGIDLSLRNIHRAYFRLSQQPNDKITFRHGTVSDLVHEERTHFDYAVLTFVIHEVDEKERVNLLKEITRVADTIIVGDYVSPQPDWFKGYFNKIVEFMGGSEHYRNYSSYIAHGGISSLAKEAGLTLVREIRNQSSSNHIVILTKERTASTE